jgi:hypothetical protein
MEFRSDDEVVCLIAILSSICVAGLIFIMDPILRRWKALEEAADPSLPRHQRPVGMPLRVWDLLLALACLPPTLGCFTFALVEARGHDDQFAFSGFAVGFGALALYFFRQATRPRRGHLWSGTLRPFLWATVAATLAICIIPFIIGLPMRGEEFMILVVVGSIAFAMAAALWILKRSSARPEPGREQDVVQS